MNDSYVALLEERRSALREVLLPIFSSTSEFVCEIGCGHGHFLTAYATAHPDQLCIGVDLVSERIERACRKRDRARLSNLHFVHAEARLLLETLPNRVRMTSLFVLFPDPWPKLRHHKHRILQPDFLDILTHKTTVGCRLYFRTDYGPYFADANEVLRAHQHWQLVDEPWPFECVTVFQQRAESFASLVAARFTPSIDGPRQSALGR